MSSYVALQQYLDHPTRYSIDNRELKFIGMVYTGTLEYVVRWNLKIERASFIIGEITKCLGVSLINVGQYDNNPVKIIDYGEIISNLNPRAIRCDIKTIKRNSNGVLIVVSNVKIATDKIRILED
uniref:Uncharacterized protein n=1 Tax=Pithovirus LCDPAC01 TaxID=2506600 RepID=A0A481YML9_9VIRU|nr:MAG: hypothetical protein LCDPAC01_00690 [Pithovirus LCDPAC01]